MPEQRCPNFELKIDEKIKYRMPLNEQKRDTSTKHGKSKKRCKSKSINDKKWERPAGCYKKYKTRRRGEDHTTRLRIKFLTALLECGDFLDYRQDAPFQDPFQYAIAIQVFQHGDMDRVGRYFEKASMLLEKGGLLFLRVNASNTTAQHGHDVIEENNTGGFTVRYNEGPKKGLDIRFFSKEDICSLIHKNDMSVIRELRNVTTERAPPCTGSWSQWEMVARKN